MKIRTEVEQDREAVYPLNQAAFESNTEADEVFMALELAPGGPSCKAGKMHYHMAFDGS